MARTDDIAIYGSWAAGVPHKITSVAFSDGRFDVSALQRLIMVTTAGDVEVEMHDGGSDILPGLQPGVQYVFTASAILEANTAATGIKLLS